LHLRRCRSVLTCMTRAMKVHAMKVHESLGYETNGTRPTPPIGSRSVPPSQGRSSMTSHLVQPVRPLPTACLLPFLLRPPQDRGGHDGRRSLPRYDGHAREELDLVGALVDLGDLSWTLRCRRDWLWNWPPVAETLLSSSRRFSVLPDVGGPHEGPRVDQYVS
jgi:hypothetical protein